jgi:hypothetical protein
VVTLARSRSVVWLIQSRTSRDRGSKVNGSGWVKGIVARRGQLLEEAELDARDCCPGTPPNVLIEDRGRSSFSWSSFLRVPVCPASSMTSLGHPTIPRTPCRAQPGSADSGDGETGVAGEGEGSPGDNWSWRMGSAGGRDMTERSCWI